jgi:predicted metal-binding protein
MGEKGSKSQAKCVAVVQCAVAKERCSGSHCALAFHRREHHFSGYGADVLYVSFSCGGCPGRRVSRLAANLKRRLSKDAGIEPGEIVVHLSACVVNESGHYPACPHLNDIKAILARKGLTVVEGSYVSAAAEERRRTGYYRTFDQP